MSLVMDTQQPEDQPENVTGDGTVPRNSSEDHSAAAARSPLTSRILSSVSEKGSVRSRSPLRDEWHMHEPHKHHGSRPDGRPWKRPKSPGLKWHKAYTAKNLTHGRVFVVDYVKQERSKEGMRKVSAQEINELEGLEKLYKNSTRKDEAVLRLFHVQNCQWAVNFFFKKFNLKPDELVGSDFGRYAKHTKPARRGGKPLLKARLWPVQHDPWRKISRTAFSMDYLKLYEAKDKTPQQEDAFGRFTELNCFDQDDDPKCWWNVYPQRTSVYIQRKQEEMSDVISDSGIENPYEKDPSAIEDMDNENVIIIFENSKSCSIEDTLIAARKEWESRWRRLPFYLAMSQEHDSDASKDDDIAVQCMRLVIQDIWTSLTQSWDQFLDISDSHVSILEDTIYENPADESRADEIWNNSSNWLKIERLAISHSNIVRQLNLNLRELVDSAAENPWLDASVQELGNIVTRIQENLIKTTDSLSDLLYKSVGIRDTRHSLELSYSMWRLSWITFVFLPLTFTVGFFGMNVDTFSNDPSLKWFFISAVPMMVLVLIAYWVFKHRFARSRQTPYSRGIYEKFFHELASNYPLLWTRLGPRENVAPRGRWEKFQWHLIQKWNVADQTIKNPRGRDEDEFDGLGSWQQCKRMLTKLWTDELSKSVENSRRDPTVYEEGPAEKFADVAQEVTDIIHENGDGVGPGAATIGMLKIPSELDQRVNQRTLQRLSIASSGRPSSQGTSGRNSTVLIEEERPDWLFQ